MFGFQASIMSAFCSEFGSPLAPSPVATRTKGEPGPGAVPVRGVKVFVLTGGEVTPLANVTAMEAISETNPSRIIVRAWSVIGPSTNRSLGRLNRYDDV